NTTELEHPYAILAMTHVVCDIRHQPANQGGTHHGQLAGNRIQKADGVFLACVVALPTFFHKREIDHFLIVERGHPMTQFMRATQGFRRHTHLGVCSRGLIRNAFEAIDAGHFLDEVFFNDQVEAVARRLNNEDVVFSMEIQTQTIENVFNLSLFKRQTQYTAAPLQPHAHGSTLWQRNDLIVQWADIAAANVDNEPGHVLQVFRYLLEVHPAFEAVTGLRTELVAARPTHDGFRPPECTLQENIRGVQSDGGRFPTHDAGHAFHDIARSNHADVRLQFDHLPVE